MKGETPVIEIGVTCVGCLKKFSVVRHACGRKRLYCDDCIRTRKNEYERCHRPRARKDIATENILSY